jgi:hypothetical protein
MNSAFVQPFTECNGPGLWANTEGKIRQNSDTELGFKLCTTTFCHLLSSVSAAESQSLSIETGLQPKRIRGEDREPEKEFLDINFTKDRVFCSMVDFKENQTLLVLKIHIKKSTKQENFILFARVASCRKEK